MLWCVWVYKLTTTTDYYYHMKKKKTRERVPHEADAGREQKYATNPAAQRDTFLLENQGVSQGRDRNPGAKPVVNYIRYVTVKLISLAAGTRAKGNKSQKSCPPPPSFPPSTFKVGTYCDSEWQKNTFFFLP